MTIDKHADMDEHNHSVSNTIPIPRILKLKTHRKHTHISMVSKPGQIRNRPAAFYTWTLGNPKRQFKQQQQQRLTANMQI